jgi:antitoxin ParD1/3/4
MQITLPPELARFVEEQVKAGRYESADGVVYAALTRLRIEDDIPPAELESLRAEVAAGIEEADRGELEPWNPDEIWAEVVQRRRKDHGASEKRAG